MPTVRRRRPERGLPHGVARGKGGPPQRSFPASRGSSNFPPSAGRRLGRARFRNFVRPPVAPGPLLRSVPAGNPHLAPRAARAHPPLRSAGVYLRPRSKRLLRWGRPHCRSLGPCHTTAKFPNKDSFGCLEVFLGRRIFRPGPRQRQRRERTPAALLRAACATAAAPPPASSGLFPPLSPSLPRSAPLRRHCRHATVTTAAAGPAALFLPACFGPACTAAGLDETAGGC